MIDARTPADDNDHDSAEEELIDDTLEDNGLLPLPDAEPSDGPAPAA